MWEGAYFQGSAMPLAQGGGAPQTYGSLGPRGDNLLSVALDNRVTQVCQTVSLRKLLSCLRSCLTSE